MIEIFVNRAEITSPAGNGAEMRKLQTEMKDQCQKDRAPGGPGLFKGIFALQPAPLLGIRDPDDGVLRCPTCTWEVHGGRCENPNCGVRVREARDGDDMSDEDDDDESSDGSSTEDGSELDIPMAPMRWPESVVGEEDDWEDAEDDEDEDGFDNEDGPMDGHRRNGGQGRRRRVIFDSEEEEEDDDGNDTDGTAGSLAEFIDDSSPEAHRRRGPWALSVSPASQNTSSPVRPVGTSRRHNARPIVIEDDEDEDAESSFSEASSAPTRDRRYASRSGGYESGHVSLSSDYEDEEDLEVNGYQALLGNQTDHTATEDEDEDDDMLSPQTTGGRHIGNIMRPNSVFSVPEEDEDGDIRMGGGRLQQNLGNNNTNGNNRQQNRRTAGGSVQQPIDLDSASESEVPIYGRPRITNNRRSQTQSGSGVQVNPAQTNQTRSGYFSAHQRNASGGNRAAAHRAANRLSMEINPDIAGLFASHSQQLRETQYNALGRNSSSVSPARSITPRNTSGRRSGAGSRGTTPLRGMLSSPPPFSPMQSPDPPTPQRQTPQRQTPQRQTPQRQFPSVIPGTSSPAQPTPNNNPWGSARATSLSPRLASSHSHNWSGILSHFHNPQRTASPMGVRVRSRQSNNRLRGTAGSRASQRANSITPSSPLAGGFASGATFGSLQERMQQSMQSPTRQQPLSPMAQQQQQQQAQQQQQQQQAQQQALQQQQQIPNRQSPNQPQTRTGGSPRLTVEDIRARGEMILQNQMRMINRGGPLQQNQEQGQQQQQQQQQIQQGGGGVSLRGDRLGALIGGGPANQRGGGPMLVIGNDDDRNVF
jgi:hypothetical protein